MDNEKVNEDQRPLNERIASLFSEKTAHLEDHEFIKIAREMLQMIGFTNSFKIKLDKKGIQRLKTLGKISTMLLNA